MNVLVFGGSGMLGHKVVQVLADAGHTVCAVARGEKARWLPQFVPMSVQVRGIHPDADPRELADIVRVSGPDVVVNCAGLIKQRRQGSDVVAAAAINAMFPHLCAQACGDVDARLIHVSTDCVFSGNRVPDDAASLADLDDAAFENELRCRGLLYPEIASPDPVDVYGQTKRLGEIDGYAHVLTLRTSLYGPELDQRDSLFEWFCTQSEVTGFVDHFWSGVTTLYFAELLSDRILDSQVSGLFHLAMPPTHKARLLERTSRVFGLSVRVEPRPAPAPLNRALDGSALDTALGLVHPSWDNLLESMRRDFEARGYR